MISDSVWKRQQQQSREPDRLLAEAGADRSLARRIALVEDEVDHRRDHGEAFGALGALRAPSKGAPASAIRALARVIRCSIAVSPRTRKARAICAPPTGRRRSGSASAICHVAGSAGCAADEQQTQHVVAELRLVEPFHQWRFHIVEIGDRLLRRQGFELAALAHVVERGVAANQDQPGGGIARRPVLGRPAFQRAGRRSGTPPRPRRDRGNSAAMRRTAWGRAAVSAAFIQARSVMSQRRSARRDGKARSGRSCIGAAGIGGGEVAGDIERLVS